MTTRIRTKFRDDVQLEVQMHEAGHFLEKRGDSVIVYLSTENGMCDVMMHICADGLHLYPLRITDIGRDRHGYVKIIRDSARDLQDVYIDNEEVD